ERLSDDAMTGAIERLRARLSSPLYGLTGEDPRRDPLGLQSLGGEAAASLARVGNTSSRGAEATATGDLLARDGASVLVQLKSSREPDAILADVEAGLQDSSVQAALVGPAATKERTTDRIEAEAPRLLALVAAGLAIVLSL